MDLAKPEWDILATRIIGNLILCPRSAEFGVRKAKVLGGEILMDGSFGLAKGSFD